MALAPRAGGGGGGSAGRWAFVLTLLYALTDEFHQAFVPERLPSILDLVTDAAGAALVLGCRRIVRFISLQASPG